MARGMRASRRKRTTRNRVSEYARHSDKRINMAATRELIYG
jgi:hypothetical protein